MTSNDLYNRAPAFETTPPKKNQYPLSSRDTGRDGMTSDDKTRRVVVVGVGGLVGGGLKIFFSLRMLKIFIFGRRFNIC